ncbi:hypothetical protein O9Z70_09040 [Devosia sp. YIM 151766]|uniref:MotE family protein n=1 Tax=Devosia sp. YIM 151766 TaxID=3017325 RepID=UPI00255CFA73|nr:hypothetical protein [Devosia sp. YIM 151766]WIY51635.1 hypothetical protein O9Z70_09040 [Devosia sp. YIM 151766]
MSNIRLLPIVILAVAALLVLKTVGLVTNGGYVLTGVAMAEAAGAAPHGGSVAQGETITMPSEPTIADETPTLADDSPTLGGPPEGSIEESDDAAGAVNMVAEDNACAPRPVLEEGETRPANGQLMVVGADCPPLADAAPMLLTVNGTVPLSAGEASLTEQALLERLAERRTELESYEQQLAMRASLVEAAEKRIEERQTTLQSIEDQIASLVEQRKQMEEGQFAGIVAMYETMKPKDAAKIFDNLEMAVLLRVSKMMSPRKMAPILAEMSTTRAQELTVRLASADNDPLDSMSPDDLAALPQIIGQ